MRQRIYIDTSVVGGYFDKEFSEATIFFFESVRRGDFSILISDLLHKELENAPAIVRNLLESIPAIYTEHLTLTPEAKQLANKYVEAGVVGKTSLDDCQHIAMATIYKADALASWNFKHIVNLKRIYGYNGINIMQGYKALEIRTPKEIMSYESN